MTRRIAGCVCAAVLTTAAFAAAQPAPQSSQSSVAQEGSERPAPGALSESGAREREVTLLGCLARETGTGPDDDQFVLTNASIMPEAAVAARRTGNEPEAGSAVGTTGASERRSDVPETLTYTLTGEREAGLDGYVGHQVTIVGRLGSNATSGDPKGVEVTTGETAIAAQGAGEVPGAADGQDRDRERTGEARSSADDETRRWPVVTIVSVMPATGACKE